MKASGRFFNLLLPSVFIAILVGSCRPATSEPSEPPPSGKFGSMNELPALRLLFEGPDGIYLYDSKDRKPVLIGRGGKWPRFNHNGSALTFVTADSLHTMNVKDSGPTLMTKVGDPKAAAYDASGQGLLFTDKGKILRIEKPGEPPVLCFDKHRTYELDATSDGVVSATVKTMGGYKVMIFRNDFKQVVDCGSGCTSALRPDGKLVTVLTRGHDSVDFHDTETGKKAGMFKAPDGVKFDNHAWSNHPDWITSEQEHGEGGILVHHIPSGQTWHLVKGDFHRPDLFVE